MVSHTRVEGAGDRPKGLLILVVVAWLGFMVASDWMLHDWLERRAGLSPDLARMAALMFGALLGAAVIRAAFRFWPGVAQGRPWTETGHRRVRAWVTPLLGLLLLAQLGRLLAASRGWGEGDDGWGFLVLVVACVISGLGDIVPWRAGAPQARADRSEALRAGCLVLVVTGGIAAVVAVRHPWVAGQAWPCVLLASVLSARMRMARLAGDAV